VYTGTKHAQKKGDMRCKHPDKGTGRAAGPGHDCCACAGSGAWLVLLEALMFRAVLAVTHSLRWGAARPIGSARGPENSLIIKVHVIDQVTGSPRSFFSFVMPPHS